MASPSLGTRDLMFSGLAKRDTATPGAAAVRARGDAVHLDRCAVASDLACNTGASFWIGAGHSLVITLTAAAVLAVALALLTRARSRAVALSLAAVAGGAAGNLADRMFRGQGLGQGAVVDWIHVAGYPATYNPADAAIRLGAACTVIPVLPPSPPRTGPGN